MPSSTSSPPAGLGENKAIKFQIKAGNARWACTLQDRATYERTKAARTASIDSVDSASSSSESTAGSIAGSSH